MSTFATYNSEIYPLTGNLAALTAVTATLTNTVPEGLDVEQYRAKLRNWSTMCEGLYRDFNAAYSKTIYMPAGVEKDQVDASHTNALADLIVAGERLEDAGDGMGNH